MRLLPLAKAAAVPVVISPDRGRSVQMNRGAEMATGDVLCFLHADTLVPDDLVTIIDCTLADSSIAGGGFISIMTGARITRWGFALLNVLKTYLMPMVLRPYQYSKGFRLLFGDQVIFCRCRDFRACGGFDPALPIMEEADLCLKLMNYGRICQVNRTVQSSDRRVAKWGEIKAIVIYFSIGILWGIGVSPTVLKRFYTEIR